MSRETVELCAIWEMPDGTEMVQTGIYVFDTMSLKECKDLMMGYAERGEKVPDRIEFRMVERDE